MLGLGTIVNAVGIFVGAILGLIFKKGLPKKWQETMMSGIAICIVVIGVQMALKTNNIVIVIFSIVIGSILGEIIDIEAGMNKIGEVLGKRIAGSNKSVAAEIAAGFVMLPCFFAVAQWRLWAAYRMAC